jgi:hypothetical protein
MASPAKLEKKTPNKVVNKYYLALFSYVLLELQYCFRSAAYLSLARPLLDALCIFVLGV